MIIRIYKFDTVAGSSDVPQYCAFLVTDTAQVCIAPHHKSFAYISELASRFKTCLSTQTTENIKIEYPPTTGQDVPVENNPAFESKLKYTFIPDNVLDRTIAAIDRPLGESLEDAFNSRGTTSRQRSREGLPFDSRGTMSGIRLQARNVAERSNLGDYSNFVGDIVRLGETLQEDLKSRREEEKAKIEPWAAPGDIKKKSVLTHEEIEWIKQWSNGTDRDVAKFPYTMLSMLQRLLGDELV